MGKVSKLKRIIKRTNREIVRDERRWQQERSMQEWAVVVERPNGEMVRFIIHTDRHASIRDAITFVEEYWSTDLSDGERCGEWIRSIGKRD